MNLDTKIPPPIVTLLILVFINLFESKDYELNTEWISIIILSMGVFFIFSAVIQFIRRKTTVNPTKPHKTTSLVITGTFKFTRNPMYLGMLLIIISFALYKSSIISLILSFYLFFILINFRLNLKSGNEKKFKEYEDYCKKVDRWFNY